MVAVWELGEGKGTHILPGSSLGKHHGPGGSRKVLRKGLRGASRLMGLHSLTAWEQTHALFSQVGSRGNWEGPGKTLWLDTKEDTVTAFAN